MVYVLEEYLETVDFVHEEDRFQRLIFHFSSPGRLPMPHKAFFEISGRERETQPSETITFDCSTLMVAEKTRELRNNRTPAKSQRSYSIRYFEQKKMPV